LVVDLDNTMWGGVLGDDGVEGLQLGDDYPGSAFKEFQAALLGYRRRGFLLAIASKNDEAPVLEVMSTHPEQLVRPEHCAHIAANWDPKPTNLRRIAAALNIGLDALVFIDDNPAERAQVRAELPMVHIVELPDDPLLYVGALNAIAVLDRPRLFDEDRERARMYDDDAKRKVFVESSSNAANYLEGMRMEALVGLADANTIGRIHQLIHKTNQFNLTTIRHEMSTLREMMENGTSRVAWLRLSDAFGDMGLVCVGILTQIEPKIWEVDTFLMSCRVMGRQVERAFLAYLGEAAREAGAEHLVARYRATAKNHIVRDFYPSQGFQEVDRRHDGQEIVFRLALSNAPAWPDFLARKEERGTP
jgi:FkbH-like protein